MAESGSSPPPAEPTDATPSPVELRRARWWGGLVYLAVNLPFLFFFYDAFNLNDTIYGSSLLSIGISPYNPGLGSTVIVGYPLLAYNQSILGSYVLTGFSILGAAVLAKLVLIAATYLAALILLRILTEERVRSWKVLYYTFLLNPFLLFVNDVWMESDALILLGILAAIFLFRYEWERRRNPFGLYGGAVALATVSLAYFTPIFLVPAFVVYARDRSSSVRTLVAIAVAGAVYGAPMALLALDPLAVRSFGTVSVFNPYSIAVLFTRGDTSPGPIVLLGLLGIAALIALVAPVLMERRGIPFEIAALTAFSAVLLLAIAYFEPDNFVLLVGLVPLAIASARLPRVTVPRVLMLEAALLPVLWIANMWNGPGQVSGVFYWSYFWLGRQVDLYTALGGLIAWKASLAITAVLVVGTVLYLVRARRAPTTAAAPESRSGPPRARTHRSTATTLTWAVLVLILAVPLAAAAVPGQSYEFQTTGEFPSQYFLVHDYDVPTLYLMPSPSTFAVNAAAGRVALASTAPAMGFVRGLTGQNFDVSVRATVPIPQQIELGTALPVVNATGTSIGIARGVVLPNDPTPLPVFGESNVTAEAGSTVVLSNVTSLYLTNGSGLRSYFLGESLPRGDSLFFGAMLTRNASAQDLLWDVGVNGTVVLEAYLVGQSFYLADFAEGRWNPVTVPVADRLGSWLLVGLSVATNGASVSASIGSTTLTVPYSSPSGASVVLYVAKFGPAAAYDGRFALTGAITDVFELPSSLVEPFTAPYAQTGDRAALLPETYGGSVEVNYSGSPSGSVLSAGGATFPIDAASSVTLAVGKLADAPVGLNLQFLRVRFGSTTPTTLLPWTVAEMGVAAPVSVAWLYFRTRQKEPDR